ncbi:MAG: FAD-dependent oxidoreductase [Firmicutes bacterium]|nr:FAD-dependent oxidoreductase [Bacillota bacterium]
MNTFDYLIIGNSAGAVGCIEGLRSVDQSGTIGLVAEEEHHVYSRALIPYYLSGSIDRDKMLYRPADFYRRAGVTLFHGQRAVKLNPGGKELELDNGQRLGYDKLLLATGGKPVYPPVAGLAKKNVFGFHSFNDLQGIEKMLPKAQNAIILGGGVIGLMAAEALKKRGLAVSVLELAHRVLAPVVDEITSGIIESALRDAGVEVFTDNTIDKIQGGELVESVTLKNGITVPCDLLIVGVGVRPRVELAEGTPVRVDGGIVVDRRMQTTAPGIYACGDCASIHDFVTGQTRPMPLWPNAYLGGRIAAFNMAGAERNLVAGASMNAMHFFGVNLISAGVNVTEKDVDKWNIISKLTPEDKVYRKFILDDNGVIKGFILVGQIKRAGIFLNLMRRKIDVRDFQQELLDENFGFGNLPGNLRWQLLKDEVILGVM